MKDASPAQQPEHKPKLLDQVRAAIRLRHYSIRTIEGLRLRVKNVDLSYRQITVRDGKGEKDRISMLPTCTIEPLKSHLAGVKVIHEQDLREGFDSVYLPYALERKYPNANREWIWRYVFPPGKRSVDPRTGVERCHHLHEIVLQRAVKEASRKVGLPKRAR